MAGKRLSVEIEPGEQMVVYVQENSIVAWLACKVMKSGNVAIVMGRTIHLWGVKTPVFLTHKQWLRHELEHIRQYRTHGKLVFWWKYLAECVRKGYYANRFEVAARKAESDLELVKKVTVLNS